MDPRDPGDAGDPEDLGIFAKPLILLQTSQKIEIGTPLEGRYSRIFKTYAPCMGHADAPYVGHTDVPYMGHADAPHMGHADAPILCNVIIVCNYIFGSHFCPLRAFAFKRFSKDPEPDPPWEEK